MFRDVSRCSGMFRNVPECSGMFHVPGFIDALLASFLDWISLSVTVVIPRPESSLSVNMQVGRKIVGAKIEIVNCLLVVCTRKWRFKIVFRKLNWSTAIKAASVWVINGSTSDRSESLDTARLFS